MSPGKPEFVSANHEGLGGLPFKLHLPGKVQALGILLLVLLILCGALYGMFLEYVRPNEYGIKEVQIGINRGIQERVYGPGLAFVMPFGFQKIHRLPRNVQVLELTDASGEDKRKAAQAGSSVYYDRAAKIQTSDGFFVDVDATILYRISDPYKVVTQLGPGMLYLHQGILPKAEPVLKEALGELTTEEFYNSPLRVEKAEKARRILDEQLRFIGIEVHQVLVRYFKYSPSIQQNIEAKKLQDQLVFTNQAKRKAATEEQALNRVTMEGQMRVAVTIEKGMAYKIQKAAEKDLYARKKHAEADLLVQLATAESTEMRNEAMQVAGADKKVAMAMAEVLRGLEVIGLPFGGEGSFNPLELNSLLTMFGVGAAGVEEGGDPAAFGPRTLEQDTQPPVTIETLTSLAAEAASGGEIAEPGEEVDQ